MTLVHAGVGVGPEPGNFLLVLCFAFGSFVGRLLLDRFVYKVWIFRSPRVTSPEKPGFFFVEFSYLL
ncbi:hypothetical protein BHE74_00016351 [Ensete ventricosum]|nr:hypothetical protein GW17_00000947 [Ensete ventricosum]RWW75613.1 hypothetical protein BHE74_00016351 [Ensete ventricosum]RZR95773.1 hypothetical protein BHM03_00024669 [Ensete ventricosum]